MNFIRFYGVDGITKLSLNVESLGMKYAIAEGAAKLSQKTNLMNLREQL
jgi:hypothetical protein